MRFALFLTCVVAVPAVAQNNDVIGFIRHASPDVALEVQAAPAYRPVRTGEVVSAPFLTEMTAQAFGTVMGPVHPQRVRSQEGGDESFPGTVIALTPPTGITYRAGDTVLLVERVAGPKGWGEIVRPVGLARVGAQTSRQTLATVLTMYSTIRLGQSVLPLPAFSNPGPATPVASDGPAGEIIGSAEVHELRQAGNMLFVNLGRSSGVKIGDVIQVRRHPEMRDGESDTIAELMAVGQVVHVGEKSATVRLLSIKDPSIPAGTPAVRVATLPN